MADPMTDSAANLATETSVTETIEKITNRHTLEEAFNVRRQVFIDEQKVPADLELDEFDKDKKTLHILARDSRGNAIGTARMRPYTEPGVGKVERVAVLKSHRRTGLGRKLMEKLELEAKELGFQEIKLNAQLHARDFYERLGYKPKGETFFEAGIEHIAMHKSL